MSIQVFDPIKHEALQDIQNVLTHSGAVSSDACDFEPIVCHGEKHFKVPTGYHVIVDYNKMAEALYAAGYRKENNDGSA